MKASKNCANNINKLIHFTFKMVEKLHIYTENMIEIDNDMIKRDKDTC